MYGFCPLASGSKGNCLYFGSKNAKVLIDAGLSGKQIRMRLQQINVALEEIDAVMITHEHMDHIEGLKVLSKMNIPVIANAGTARGIYASLRVKPRFKIFTTNETFEFKDLTVHPFSIQHDTLDPVGYTIRFDCQKMGICTDLGFASSLVVSNLEGCDYLYLEANHDVNMLHASSRPEANKQRILGRQGHLANEASAGLLSAVSHAGLKRVYLAHLSEECNHPDRALSVVRQAVGSALDIRIAWQNRLSDPLLFYS